MTETYHVSKAIPCRNCGGKSKKCCICKGAGVEFVAVTEPVSVLVWQAATQPPTHGDLVLLAFRDANGVIGVHIARYFLPLSTWVTAQAVGVPHPIAYAELTLPAELAEVTP